MSVSNEGTSYIKKNKKTLSTNYRFVICVFTIFFCLELWNFYWELISMARNAGIRGDVYNLVPYGVSLKKNVCLFPWFVFEIKLWDWNIGWPLNIIFVLFIISSLINKKKTSVEYTKWYSKLVCLYKLSRENETNSPTLFKKLKTYLHKFINNFKNLYKGRILECYVFYLHNAKTIVQ